MSKFDELIQQYCPNGVEYKRFDEVCSLHARIGWQRLTKAEYRSDGEYLLITGTDFTLTNEINYAKCVYVSKERYSQDPKIQLSEGDILITKDGTLGKVAQVNNLPKPATLNGGVFVVRPTIDNILDRRFILHYLQSKHFKNVVEQQKTGSTISHLTQNLFSRLLVPLPPLPVQREIVRILDGFTEKTDYLKNELAVELTARKEQFKYYRDSLFTYDDVEYKTLPELSVNCDKQRKPVTKGNRKVGEFPYYGASGIVDYVSEYIFDGDYLLVSEDGANLLARSTPIAFSISGKTWVNNHAHILRFDTYEMRKYVEIYLNSIDLGKYISGGAQPKLNQENLNKIPIPVPLEHQISDIVQVLNRFETLCNDITGSLPAEIEARQKQYEYYRDKLLTFKRKES